MPPFLAFLTPYIGYIKAGGVVAAFSLTFYAGYHYCDMKHDAAMVEAVQKAVQKQKDFDKVAIATAVDYGNKQAAIAENTQELLRKVRTNVPKSDGCPLSSDYVSLWNASLYANTPAGRAGKPDGGTTPAPAAAPVTATQPVTAIDALENAVVNYGTCTAIREQLVGLQHIVREFQKAQTP